MFTTRFLHAPGLYAILVVLMLGSSPVLALGPDAAPSNLVFQADIYGDEAPETIAYRGDLTFDTGGGGTNPTIFGANFSGGDGISFGIRGDAEYVFLLRTAYNGQEVDLGLSPTAYGQGQVEQTSPNNLHFSWNVSQGELVVKLHRYVELVHDDPAMLTEYRAEERFELQNLGPAFTLLSFGENLRLDDTSDVRDYDDDGYAETLLAIDRYPTGGYPVFGKVYRPQPEIVTTMSAQDGGYAAVTHGAYLPVGHGSPLVLASAAYISSMARSNEVAEAEVADDAAQLHGLNAKPVGWYARSWNADDRGAIFVNGLLVIASTYGTDSGWTSIGPYWRPDEPNIVSLASYDAQCCGSSYALSLRRNDTVIWSGQGPGSQLGVSYQHVLQVSPDGTATDYTEPAPPEPLEGAWTLSVRADGGTAFGLVGSRVVVGSTQNQLYTATITSLLGVGDNKIHLNVWDHDGGDLEWSFVLQKDGHPVWERGMTVHEGAAGRVFHVELGIDEEGNVYPKFDLPIDYPNRPRGVTRRFNAAFNTRTSSLFDHQTPNNSSDGSMLLFTNSLGSNPAGPAECRLPYCYDGHPGYDFVPYGTSRSVHDGRAIYPLADGAVVAAETGWRTELGCVVTVDHGSGWRSVYANLFDPEQDHNCDGILRADGLVTQYDQIGVVGCATSGCPGGGYTQAGTHLHLEVQHQDGTWQVVDPSGWEGESAHDPWTVDSFPQWLYRYNQRQAVPTATGGDIRTSDGVIRVALPDHYSLAPLTFRLSGVPAADVTRELASAGVSFSLTAFDAAGGVVSSLAKSAQVVVHFEASELPVIKRKTLALFWWDEAAAAWCVLPTAVDWALGTATTQVDHSALFALMAEPLDKIYLPLMRR